MRARHRHFNSVHAGAATSLDGRFITGFANDASMNVWTGRAGSTINPTQDSEINKPKFKISAINGPGVYFDDQAVSFGANYFEDTISLNANNVSTVSVAQKTANNSRTQFGRVVGFYKSGGEDYNSLNAIIMLFLGNDNFGGHNPAAAAWRNLNLIAALPYTLTESIVSSTVINGSGATLTKNGSVTTGTTSATALDSDRIRIGAGTTINNFRDANFLGYISRIDVFFSAIEAPMRRRCEHAAAFSFKIACS